MLGKNVVEFEKCCNIFYLIAILGGMEVSLVGRGALVLVSMGYRSLKSNWD
jgi:hypothetical protein